MEYYVLELPQWLSGKESACDVGDAVDSGLVPGLGRSPGEGNSYPLQYACLGNFREYEDCLERSQEMHFYQEYTHGISLY